MAKASLYSKEEAIAKAEHHYNRGVDFLYVKKQPVRALIELTLSIDTKPLAKAYEERSCYHAWYGDIKDAVKDTAAKEAIITEFERAFQEGMKHQLDGNDAAAYASYSHALDQGLKRHDFLAHITKFCNKMTPNPQAMAAAASAPIAEEPTEKLTISITTKEDKTHLWKSSERNLSLVEQILQMRRKAPKAAAPTIDSNHLHPQWSQKTGSSRSSSPSR